MSDEQEIDVIQKAFDEGTPIDEAIRSAVQAALRRHKRAGNPVAEWRDGKVVWVKPEDINVPDEPGLTQGELGEWD